MIQDDFYDDNDCDDDEYDDDGPEDEDDVDHDDGFLVKYFWQLYEEPLPAKTFKLLASASRGNGGVDKTSGIFALVAGIISSAVQ